MIESIALALIKTLATYLLKTYLYASHVKIDGAPGWYMQNVSSSVCVYDHKYGDLSAVDYAKASASEKMNTEITRIIETVIYDSYRDLKDPKEKAFVYAFSKDPELKIFINKTGSFNNIEYNKKQRTAYVQLCVEKQSLVDYQKERADKIWYALSHKRADDAFQEMEQGSVEFK